MLRLFRNKLQDRCNKSILFYEAFTFNQHEPKSFWNSRKIKSLSNLSIGFENIWGIQHYEGREESSCSCSLYNCRVEFVFTLRVHIMLFGLCLLFRLALLLGKSNFKDIILQNQSLVKKIYFCCFETYLQRILCTL